MTVIEGTNHGGGLRFAIVVSKFNDFVTDRLQAARPTPTADSIVRTLKPGEHLLLVQPILRTGKWKAPWTKLVKRRVIQWERVLDNDPRMSRTLAVPSYKHRRPPRGVRMVLYERY